MVLIPRCVAPGFRPLRQACRPDVRVPIAIREAGLQPERPARTPGRHQIAVEGVEGGLGVGGRAVVGDPAVTQTGYAAQDPIVVAAEPDRDGPLPGAG